MALGSALVFLAAGGCQLVKAPAALTFDREPALFYQAEHRCTHQALIDTQWLEGMNEAAQPDLFIVLRDDIAKQRDDEGFCAHRLAIHELAAYAVNDSLDTHITTSMRHLFAGPTFRYKNIDFIAFTVLL